MSRSPKRTPQEKSSRRWRPSRRDLLHSFLGAGAALAAGCGSRRPQLPPAGQIVGGSHEAGHLIRDAASLPQPAAEPRPVSVVIVGGGVAGLAAARRLRRAGCDNFLLLELESELGGTARAGESAVCKFPWGAHYLPAPHQENRPLVALLDELDCIERYSADGEPVWREEVLCGDPEERLFIGGQWHEELFPADVTTDQDRADWQKFQQEIDRWVRFRDASGRRAFALPSSLCSNDSEVAALDKLSMAQWLDERELHAPHLRWMVDYACRDDYGALAEDVSAWAGLFYFASRVRSAGSHAAPLLTWPEGNGRLVAHLARSSIGRSETGYAVVAMRLSTTPAGKQSSAEVVDKKQSSSADSVLVTARHTISGELRSYLAQRVIFAAPQFLAPYLIEGYRDARGQLSAEFRYGAWMVANLHLRDRPAEAGPALAWDNVLFDSPSLGYVAATHQLHRDYGPTVLTYYYPLCDTDPKHARQRLLSLDWADGADVTLCDLEQAHPDLRPLVERLDVMRWGHAMIRPGVGFRFGSARQKCAAPFHGVHFAHSDLSGLALFEEAFDQGNRAASEVLASLAGRP